MYGDSIHTIGQLPTIKLYISYRFCDLTRNDSKILSELLNRLLLRFRKDSEAIISSCYIELENELFLNSHISDLMVSMRALPGN